MPQAMPSHDPSCTCLEHPLHPSMRVREALDHYLAENGFTREAYDAPRTDASFLGVRFTVPNTPGHRVGIMLHDLHHVATGFGTDIVGEGEVSAWEVRGGLRGLDLYVGSLVVTGTMVGLVRAPLRIVDASRVAEGPRHSLFGMTVPYEQLLEMTVGELRTLLGVPQEGAARARRRLHAYAPKAAMAATG